MPFQGVMCADAVYPITSTRLLAVRQRAGLRLEADETRAVFERDLLVLLIAQYERHFSRPDVARFGADAHSQPARQDQHDLPARVVTGLRSGSFRLRVPADLQLFAGDGRTLSGGMARRDDGARDLVQLEEWH